MVNAPVAWSSGTTSARLVGCGEAVDELVYFSDDESFQGVDVALAEKWVQGRPSHPMDIVLDCRKQGPSERPLLLGTVEPRVPVALVFVAAGVDSIKEVRVVDV